MRAFILGASVFLLAGAHVPAPRRCEALTIALGPLTMSPRSIWLERVYPSAADGVPLEQYRLESA